MRTMIMDGILTDIDTGDPVIQKNIVLRDYQKEAVDKIRESMGRGVKRIIYHAGTGSGKTATSSDIIAKANAKGKKVLFLAARRELIFQAKRTLEGFGLRCGVIMAGEEHTLDAQVQIASMQTYVRRMNLQELESNRWWHDADLVICDECLHEDTMVSGKMIKDIKPGFMVDSYNEKEGKIEKKEVIRVFKNPHKKLYLVKMSNGSYLKATENHKIAIKNKGYLKVKDLCANMVIITDAKEVVNITMETVNEECNSFMCGLWGYCRRKEQKQETQISLSCVQKEEDRIQEDNFACQLLGMRDHSRMQDREPKQGISCQGKDEQSFLFGRMQECRGKCSKSKIREIYSRIQQEICIGQDDGEQSYERSGYIEKNERNEDSKWNLSQMSYIPWREWPTCICSAREVGKNIGMGNRDNFENKGNERKNNKNAEPLQDRYCQHREENSYRGGREFSQRPEGENGQKKGRISSNVRVESIEIYEPRDNEKSEFMCGSSFVYDLEVEGNHNYFANGILVHNCHSAISPSWQKILQAYGDKMFVIGLTATPCRGDGRGLGEYFDEIISTIDVGELINQGYLVPVRYFAPSTPDLEGIKTVAGDYDKKELGERVNTVKLVGDIYENWAITCPTRPTIIFATNVKHSISIKETFLRNGIKIEHIDAKTPKEERSEALDGLKSGKLQVITNVGILTEGFDFPEASCIVLARPTKSLGLYIQMAGRGLRIAPGKIDLVIMDHAGCLDNHGRVEWSREWTLDGKERAWKEIEKKDKDDKKKMLKCAVCHAVFEDLIICPDCQSPLQRFGRKIETEKAELKEIDGKKATVADKRIFLGMLKHWVPRQKNPNHKRVNGIFKGRFGIWPHHSYADVAPIVPDQEFLNRMKYEAIKFAKSRSKHGN